MKGKNLAILIVVAVVLGGLAYLSSTKRDRATRVSKEIGQHLVPALQDADTIQKVQKLTFESSDTTVTVARVDGKWVAPDAYNYPVDFSKVSGFAEKLADTKIGQVVRLTDDLRSSLELNEGGGTTLRMLDAGDAEVVGVKFGKEHERKGQTPSPYGGYPDGRYVSVDGKAYLVAEAFSDMPRDSRAWLDKEIVNQTAADIQKVTVSGSAGSSLEFVRNGSDLELAGLGEDEKMESYAANSLANLFSYLNLTDIAAPSLTDAELGFTNALKVVAEAKNGKIYTALIGGSPEGSADRYLRLSASFNPPPVPDEESAAADDDDKAADARAEAARERKAQNEKLQSEVDALNAAVGPWTYVVSSYKVASVSTERTTFIKKKEGKSDEDSSAAEGPAAADHPENK